MKDLIARVILAYKRRIRKPRKRRPLKDRLKARRYYKLHRNEIKLRRNKYLKQNRRFLKKRKSFKRKPSALKFKKPVLKTKTTKKRRSIHAPKRKTK